MKQNKRTGVAAGRVQDDGLHPLQVFRAELREVLQTFISLFVYSNIYLVLQIFILIIFIHENLFDTFDLEPTYTIGWSDIEKFSNLN